MIYFYNPYTCLPCGLPDGDPGQPSPSPCLIETRHTRQASIAAAASRRLLRGGAPREQGTLGPRERGCAGDCPAGGGVQRHHRCRVRALPGAPPLKSHYRRCRQRPRSLCDRVRQVPETASEANPLAGHLCPAEIRDRTQCPTQERGGRFCFLFPRMPWHSYINLDARPFGGRSTSAHRLCMWLHIPP